MFDQHMGRQASNFHTKWKELSSMHKKVFLESYKETKKLLFTMKSSLVSDKNFINLQYLMLYPNTGMEVLKRKVHNLKNENT